MHAGIEQLLNLRDGEPVGADTIQHVEACALCGHELTRLRTMQNSLRALPKLQAPYFNATTYSAATRTMRLKAVPQTSRYAISGVLAAGIAAIAIAVAINFTTGRATDGTTEIAATTSALGQWQPSDGSNDADDPIVPNRDISQVVILSNQSRRLERLLREMPDRPHVERAGTAGTIDTLEQRIQWVDYQLSVSNEVGLNEQQSTQLWQNRVTLMDSLIKVRFAEAQRVAALL